jgi:RNA methyltransferase, TrmH family
MLSKNQIKSLRALQRKKERLHTGFYVVEGKKIVHEIIDSTDDWVELYATKSWLEQYPEYASLENVFEITDKDLAQVSSFKTPNEVMLLLKQKAEVDFLEVHTTDIVLALDGIKDPGNMGTIIRLADWFGVGHILCTTDSVDQYNPKVVQSAMGSIRRVNLHYGDLVQMLTQLDSHKIYACDLNGESIYDTSFKEKAILIMGSESHGISKEVGRIVDSNITIPSVSNTGIDSLNVASATAISLSLFRSK